MLELLDIVWGGLHRDGCQGGLLQLRLLVEVLESLQVFAFHWDLRVRGVTLQHLLHPLVLESLLGRESLFWLADELFDQIFGLLGDLIPLFTVEIEFAPLDHLQDLLIVISIEWWISAQEDVKDAAGGPHVALDAVISRENLW